MDSGPQVSGNGMADRGVEGGEMLGRGGDVHRSGWITGAGPIAASLA